MASEMARHSSPGKIRNGCHAPAMLICCSPIGALYGAMIATEAGFPGEADNSSSDFV
jgi:hypothetical protein